MNEPEALRSLDEIERLDPDPTFDVRASQIMETVGENPQGLRLLVERYSGSLSVNIANSLAFTLNLQSSHSTSETAPLVFEFAANVKRYDSDGVLMNTLNAMKNQISFGPGWGNTLEPPRPLFPFLEHSLIFSGKQSTLVHYAAVELVTLICERELVAAVFKRDEWKWIEKRIDELSDTDYVLLQEALVEFRDCVTRANHS